MSSREHLLQYEPKSLNDLPTRSMQDSFTSAIIPLSTDLALQEKYVTFMGHVRLGRLMEDMDLFAGKIFITFIIFLIHIKRYNFLFSMGCTSTSKSFKFGSNYSASVYICYNSSG